ncbi:MAG: type VII secretion integral membrane protein EccD, partial [Janthinobacterium lividum]
MSSTPVVTPRSQQLCRLTVHGPSGRADLAVPLTATIVSLLPQLARFVVRADDVPDGVAEYGSWVLQRLGEAPAGPDETPASLGWLDGDEVYLVVAEETMPELDFDDVADGIATTVSRHPDRWGANSQRWTFALLALAAVADAAVIVLRSEGGVFTLAAALALTVGLATAAVLLARRGDTPLSTLAAASAMASAWMVGGMGLTGGSLVVHPSATSLTLAAVVAALAAGLFLVLRRWLAPTLPLGPVAVALSVVAGVLIAVFLHVLAGFQTHRAATMVAVAWFVALLSAPKLAVRIARIRAPQLPRDGSELRIDDEPLPAAELAIRTTIADTTLTGLAVGAGLSLVPLMTVALRPGGWLPETMVAVLTALVALRAREFRAVPQRLALVVAVVGGVWLLTTRVVQPAVLE